MALKRETVDKIAEELAAALLRVFKDAREQGVSPPLGAMATAERLLGSIEVGRGETPVVPPLSPPSEEENAGASPLDALRARGVSAVLPFPKKP